MLTRPAITQPELNGFGWNLGLSEYIVWSRPRQILGAIRGEARAGDRAEFLFFFYHVNNARLYRFPVSQISRNLHTRRGSERWWIISENIWENLMVGGLFQKGQLLREHRQRLPTSGRDICEMIANLGKSRLVVRAYGMLAFHLSRWNQLKVILLACRLRTRNDIPGHRWWLFRLALQT